MVRIEGMDLPDGRKGYIQTQSNWVSHRPNNDGEAKYLHRAPETPSGNRKLALEGDTVDDVKTRKLLTMHGEFHLRLSTLRLYEECEKGGK